MFLSRCARAKATHSWGWTYLFRPVRIGSGSKRCSGACRLVLARQRGAFGPTGWVPACAAAVAVRSPAHTRVRGLNFLYSALPVWGYRGTVRDGSAFVICTIGISRFDNEPITAGFTNCLCRSTRRVRLTLLRRNRHAIVSQLTQILWPGSPFAAEPQSHAWPALARTELRKIQQILRIGTRRAIASPTGSRLD
jgi:hypothetical protein